MRVSSVDKILRDYKRGRCKTKDVLEEMQRYYSYDDLGFAKVDTNRVKRKGYPETIFCKGKTIKQIIDIIDTLSRYNVNILATKADKRVYNSVKKRYPKAVYNQLARTITIVNKPVKKNGKGVILVVTAGTSDIPVAEEAVVTAELMGNKVEKVYDIGVAGVHRVWDVYDKIKDASVIIVVAGMEGALASVIGGLTSKPVIAVPTSIGYGASFKGIAPLLTMLNCCAEGVVVVNIDNGFGAGYFASLINR
ncbi:MAG: nickel pincer cofactor biosynthesis protein LarB [Candidatus Thermoplasmatota archaeon]